eukprot:UN06817
MKRTIQPVPVLLMERAFKSSPAFTGTHSFPTKRSILPRSRLSQGNSSIRAQRTQGTSQ